MCSLDLVLLWSNAESTNNLNEEIIFSLSQRFPPTTAGRILPSNYLTHGARKQDGTVTGRGWGKMQSPRTNPQWYTLPSQTSSSKVPDSEDIGGLNPPLSQSPHDLVSANILTDTPRSVALLTSHMLPNPINRTIMIGHKAESSWFFLRLSKSDGFGKT